jgi:hypothetical protein
MKRITLIFSILMSSVLLFSHCAKDIDLDETTKAHENASMVSKVLKNNTVKYVKIYEYNYSTGKWGLAADSQTYITEKKLFYVENNFFYLDGSGSKGYAISGENPSHQWSGIYYFDLAYLVSSEVSDEVLYLYFAYGN